jgi:hypothetical protein
VKRGHVARRQPISCSASELVLIGSLPYTLVGTAKSASGTAGGFIGRQPVIFDSIVLIFIVSVRFSLSVTLFCSGV